MRLNTDRPDMLMRFLPGHRGLISSVRPLSKKVTRYKKPRRLKGDVCLEMKWDPLSVWLKEYISFTRKHQRHLNI